MSIISALMRCLGVLALVQVAEAATTGAPASLPGEYRRSFDLDETIGVKVTLGADKSFSAIVSGNVSKSPHSEIDEGEIGSASGSWEVSGDEVHLIPTVSSGVLVKRYLRYRVEQCHGVPALLPQDELVQEQLRPPVEVPQSRFVRLLLKERVTDRTRPGPNSSERKSAEQNWSALVHALLEDDPSSGARFVGKIVSFEGERANVYDTSELRVEVKVNGSRIQCRVHNSIDGTRLAEFWTAGMVGVWVRGEIVAVDQAGRTVEVRPLEASPTWAR